LSNILEPKEVVLTEGFRGSGRGEVLWKTGDNVPWLYPSAIALDSKLNIFVVDPANHRINKYDKNGRFVAQWPLVVPGVPDPVLFVSDMTTDVSGRLYLALAFDQKILVYNASGELDRVVNLDGKRVCHFGFLWVSCVLRIARIEADPLGNVFLRGSDDELVKLDKMGDVIMRWHVIPFFLVRSSFVLAPDGTFYVVQDNKTVEVYDPAGKYLRSDPCGQGLSYWDNGYCTLPRYIDGRGMAFHFAYRRDIGKGRNTVVRVDINTGSRKEFLYPENYYGQNDEKFGIDGNLYTALSVSRAGEVDFFEIKKLVFGSDTATIKP
jgi:hypothetical protein